MYIHTYKCTYVSVYLIWGRVKKKLILPLWEMTSHASAFFELLSLLNYLYQGHEKVEMPTEAGIRVLYKGSVHQDWNCLSALSGAG